MKLNNVLKLTTIFACAFLALTLIQAGSLTVEAKVSNQHVQEAEVDSSGGILVGTQRQSKGDNSTQSLTIKKSGGIIFIIQRNLNCRVKDIKEMFDNNNNEG